MTKSLLAVIRWQEVYSGSAYLYGSSLDFSGESVLFQNPRLASGKPIVRFLSKTNYQGNRRSPDLPLLIPNQTYFLERSITTEPAGRMFAQIDFFNRQNEKISFEVLRQGIEQFVCPPDTFSYTISIFSAGCTQLCFKEMRLYQEEQDAEMKCDSPLQKQYTEKQLPEELQFVKPLIQLV
ncbi:MULTISPECIES: accessory Sec system protein Asp3 [unclassified Streptococcus]|uniref:accessory Sec system protein Asp3 n=1 Tax=unclassified Streptococcus TaxID=2608887 RepID=UPI001071786D|nr:MULTISPECIES: accessory Sec system protein Asp3 [unclassified Streptococcus]MBF0787141.1 accessory Sec system protein Asp3 [Streptococcus sp. 19428wC2_LYSM12]MCQ9212142.1 accessory Sec system protein Asp3 [Streptococcus sp. B01]MCQ9213471.1 accessory Sec system protein Asp3 [Streptococcus sp. O1]TFV05898.1 accessory Sec system protein Asp3 [Streptococcus sp. LYSM12]